MPCLQYCGCPNMFKNPTLILTTTGQTAAALVSGGAQGMTPESKREVARALTHTLKLSLRHKVCCWSATGALMLPYVCCVRFV